MCGEQELPLDLLQIRVLALLLVLASGWSLAQREGWAVALDLAACLGPGLPGRSPALAAPEAGMVRCGGR